MKSYLRPANLLFLGLMILMTVIVAGSLISAAKWINRPFAGFLLYDFPLAGSMNLSDWHGRKAGLQLLDRIVSFDNQEIQEGRDLVQAIGDKIPGTQVHYKVESKGELREYILPVTNFGIKDFFLVFFLTFLGGVAVLCLGCIVYVLKPNVNTSWVFFLYCFFLSMYMVTSFEAQSSYIFVHFHYFALCIMSAVLFHLGLIFPERKRILHRLPVLEYLIYLPAVILTVGYQIFLFSFDDASGTGLLSTLPGYIKMAKTNRFFTLFCVAGMIVSIFHSIFTAPTTLGRQRGRMVLFGVTLAFLPSVTIMLLVALLDVNFPWNFLVFFVLFFPASIAYSIVKHNLFDADTIIKRTVGYMVTTGIVIGAYAAVSITLNVLLGRYELTKSQAFPILFTLGVILVFNPLRNRIQALVDRVFFRKEYDYGEVIDKIGGAITSLMDLGQVLKRLTQTFIDDMFINTTSVMLLSPDGSTYQVYLADGEKRQDVEKIEIKRDSPLIEIIEKEKKELTKYDVLEDKKFKKVSESCAANFEALHASLMVPLIFQDKVIGLLNLGEKKSGKFYNREDVDLLHTVSNQGAVAIENARLFQENLEKQRMEEELAIGRELQMSMLPATCPEIDNFDFAAFSTPAREVGGDFYDFIEMGPDKLGFVIGDVTGKSVSGALVMSASRSVFRMLSEEELGVGESMNRANKRIKKDIKSGMFVALLYVVLNAKNKSLNLCSAGQTQPIHLSAESGQAVLVETEGDTFPLGILDDANYEETNLQLMPGDKIVFYTDGIVEAMDPQEEMFGFERLLEVVQSSQTFSADELLQEIMDKVGECTGNAPQHDDLTVIVLNVANSSQSPESNTGAAQIA
jgi:sigma-B regulation protein RsbU (phosphoserine phosphatase)